MALPRSIEIVPPAAPLRARISVPGSKSETNRALILSALAEGPITLRGALWSDDTQVMVDALRSKRIPVGYLLFEGEGHGFRQGQNIMRATEGELYFYSFTALDAGLRF